MQSEITKSELANPAGISAGRIDQLVEVGTLTRTARGKFNLADSVQGLIAHC